MPRLLKNDTVRLIEGSIEALGLAQIGICTFRRDELKIPDVRFSPEIGLIGSSIEMAMSAILVQSLGKKAIFRDGDKYKTASEILQDFRKLLRQSSTNISFLTNGVQNSEKHIHDILGLTNRFSIIITGRAGGLHSGFGLSYEVTASLFQEVTLFLSKISLSNNFKPYMPRIPQLVGIHIDKKIIIDDLSNKLRKASKKEEQRQLISSLFLILPEIPKELPDWLEKFDRVKVAPKKSDIVYLINALEKANPVVLKKIKSGSDTINVRIADKDDETAIPISPQYLRTEFTKFKEQVYSDIGNSNGRLGEKQLDLPPTTSILKLFHSDLHDSGILDEGSLFTAHQVWPFVIKALNVSSTGTTSPFWFMVRMTNEVGQLKALLSKAAKFGNSTLKKNVKSIIPGIDAIENDLAFDIKGTPFESIVQEIETYSKSLEKFQKIYEKQPKHNLPQEYQELINDTFDDEIPISRLITRINQDENLGLEAKRYWLGKLTLVMPQADDIKVLAAILEMSDYSNCQTNIRKGLRALDFNVNGPKVASV